jgi:hypothetical protein
VTRLLSPFFLATVAFLMRWFVWRWRDEGEGWSRRLVYSSAWAIGVLVLLQVFLFFFNRVVAG